jgi:phage-related protein
LVFNVDFYKKADNSCPVEDFLNSLDNKMRAKVLREILLLENNGNELREPYSKPLGDGIFELRMQQGSDIARVLYFFLIGKNIILTNGFVKKTPKTPPGEIELAKKYRKDYLERKKF